MKDGKIWSTVRWVVVTVFIAGMAWASVRQVPDLQKRVTASEKKIIIVEKDVQYISQGVVEIKDNQKEMNRKLDRLLLK